MSKATIVILVILTLVISILGTWTVLVETEGAPVRITFPGSGAGSARLGITGNAHVGPQSSAGQVTMTILPHS